MDVTVVIAIVTTIVVVVSALPSFEDEFGFPDHVHVVSEFSVRYHNTHEMLTSIDQPYISISFNANGTTYAYNLERDCSTFDEDVSFEFYEYSVEQNDTILIDSLKPTCNHYQSSYLLRSGFFLQREFYSVGPVKLIAQNIDGIDSVPNDVIVMTKTKFPDLDIVIDKNAQLNDRRREIKYWDNCYIDDPDAYPRMVNIYIVADSAYTSHFSSKVEVMQSISSIIERTNQLYKAQFNIAIGLSSSPKIMMSPGYPSWNKNKNVKNEPRSCGWPGGDKDDITAALTELTLWVADNQHKDPGLISKPGLVHLLSDCFGMVKDGKMTCSGTVGLAKKGVLCQYNHNTAITNIDIDCDGKLLGNTWLTFAHEVGHNLNASHTSDKDGGIMAYGDGTHDGEIQFHFNNTHEICSEIRRAMSDTPRCLEYARYKPHKLKYHWRAIYGHCDCINGKIETTNYECSSDYGAPVNPKNCDEKFKPAPIQTSCKSQCDERFVWVISEDGEKCEASIQGISFGYKRIPYRCNDTLTGILLEDYRACSDVRKPDDIRLPCETGTNLFQWDTKSGPWGECSKICGTGGIQSKTVICENINGEPVDRHHYCEEQHGPFTPETRSCNTRRCPDTSLDKQCRNFGYFSGSCEQLITGCGELICRKYEKNREKCVSFGNPLLQRVSLDTLCNNGKGLCRNSICASDPLWSAGPWSKCSNCTQVRDIQCKRNERTFDQDCVAADRPEDNRPCLCVDNDTPKSESIPESTSDDIPKSTSESKSMIGIIVGVSAGAVMVLIILGLVARKKGYISRKSTTSMTTSKPNPKESLYDISLEIHNNAYAGKIDFNNEEEYVSIYDYNAQRSDEIEFRSGDRFIVLEIMDDGWYRCRSVKSGIVGMVPGSYLKKSPGNFAASSSPRKPSNLQGPPKPPIVQVCGPPKPSRHSNLSRSSYISGAPPIPPSPLRPLKPATLR